MNESEKIKEQILTNIKTYLITDLTETQINSVIIVLSRELQDVVITNQKDLPSVDVVDNNKICNSYLATKKLKDLVIIL
mgnify:CR=1 FL=1